MDLSGATAVSSADYDAALTAEKAFDGLRLSTGANSNRWASPTGALPHWIYVDLGEDVTLKQVLLDWEAAYGVDYTLRGRTSAEGPSTEPSEWTELAMVLTYAQSGHGLDGPDVVFDFEQDRIVLQSATIEPFVSILTGTEPKVRYLMLEGQTSSLGLFSVWELQVNAEGSVRPPAPEISVTGQAGGITIAWPAEANGYVLESAGSLPATSWTPVAGVENNSVTLTPPGTTFYRLRSTN
jgi:hypothetical protein